MNSKRVDKEEGGDGGGAGFLLGSTQKSFIRLVMVVQFHQITAEISSGLKNEMNCDFTSRSLLLSTLRGAAAAGAQATSLLEASANWWEQRPLSCLTRRSSPRAGLMEC